MTRWVMSPCVLCSGARDVTALRSMFCEQEQPGIGGHQRLVETERQTSASGQLRIDTLGD